MSEEKEISKQEQLKLLIKQCNKQLGVEGKIYLASESAESKRIKTGVLALDLLLGGGLPTAQLTEMFGSESSSKSLLSLIATASVQKQGGTVVWVNGEGRPVDISWAKELGVDTDNLILVEAATGDTMLETALTMLESGLVNLMVIDSIQSLDTTREQEDGVAKESYGGAGIGQLWGKIMRRAYRAANMGKLDNTAMIAISQVRSKIGGYSKGLAAMEGVPSQIHAILHWKAISIRCRRGEVFWTEGQGKGKVYAKEFKLKCEKNKTARTENASSSYDFRIRNWDGVATGVDNVPTIFDMGKFYGVISMEGRTYSAHGQKLGIGEEQAILGLRNSPELCDKLYDEIIEKAKSKDA